MDIRDSLLELVGDTPIVNLKKFSKNIYAKCEFMNPSSSIKDRAARGLILSYLNSNRVDKDTTLIEPTSGNTGVALASICASLDLKLILTMPESMSIERRKLLKFLGAELILTPKELGMQGSLDEAKRLNSKIENSIIVGQFENDANPNAHRESTALEIIEQMDSDIDIFVAGVGTGGTLTGVGETLKAKLDRDIKVVAIEPKDSAILSKESPAPHKIQGIGAGFIPKILNQNIYDEILKVSNQDAIDMAREIAKREGLLVGISSGANLFGAMELSSRYPDKKIVTTLCDSAERYLSTELFQS